MSHNNTRFVPLSNFLLVEKNEPERTLSNGLHLPDSAIQQRHVTAKVLAIGPKVGEDSNILPGDEILLAGWNNVLLLEEGQNIGLLEADGVICKIMQNRE